MSQCEMLLEHMKRKPITSLAASVNYHITSLHRRIADLRNRGYVIDAEQIDEVDKYGKKQRYKQYFLIASPK